jgi:hypothetical protein
MSRATIDRRRFLGSAAATAAFFAAHDMAALGGQVATAPDPPRPRLLALELLAGAPLGTMKAFYGKTLDLRILEEASDRFTVEAGETQLTFIDGNNPDPGTPPFYHFAFNIPENKIRQALEWQQARTPILAIPEQRRASAYPPHVLDDRPSNAHSIFFNDPAGNLVEYIARHDLKNGDSAPFGWADLLYVSEIGLIVDDVVGAAGKLADGARLTPFKGGTGDVAALGDEYGLILLMKRGRRFDFASTPQPGAGVYRTGITLRAAKAGKYELEGYPYRVVLEERCTCA